MTDVTLREHIEGQIKWLDRYFDLKIMSINDAVAKAEQALSRRLEGMNEFRDSLKDQAAPLATKSEVDMQINSIDERLKALEFNRAKGEGKMAVISAGVAVVISLVVAVIAAMLK